MACFIVPAAEAVVSTAVTKVVRSKEKNEGHAEESGRLPFSRKLGWLNNMLWGGSALLAFEHIWHGEVTPWFPFLSAANSADTAAMLHEMSTVGVAMAALVTAVWGGMVAVTHVLEKRAEQTGEHAMEGNVEA